MLNLVEIGRNIAWLRELGDQSREDLALEAGMSISRLQELECGCENTTMETLRRIAEALNISPLTLEVLNYPDEEIVFMLRQRPPEMPEWRPGRIQLGSNIVFLRRLRGLTQR